MDPRKQACNFDLEKEEAERLIEKAKLCLRSGRKDRALQLLYEAQRRYPSTRARGKFSSLGLCSSPDQHLVGESSALAPSVQKMFNPATKPHVGDSFRDADTCVVNVVILLWEKGELSPLSSHRQRLQLLGSSDAVKGLK